jgi:hypothetical protein
VRALASLLLVSAFSPSDCMNVGDPNAMSMPSPTAMPTTGTTTPRTMTFDNLTAGPITTVTEAQVSVTAGSFMGASQVTAENRLGAQDLVLDCGMIVVRPPEPHTALQIMFNDDGGPLELTILDQSGQAFGGQSFDSRNDASTLGVFQDSPAYKELQAQVGDSTATRLIGSIQLAGCGAIVHEIILQ